MSLSADISRHYGQGKEVKNLDGWLTMCPVHGNTNTPALSVTDEGDSVKVFCHAGCDFKEIKDRFRADGLLPEWKADKSTKPATSTVKKPDAPSAPEKESFIYKQADKDHPEEIKKYFANRSIKLDHIPPCLRWGKYTPKGENEETVYMVVAAASKPNDKKVYAVQRLFIDTETFKKTGGKMHGQCAGRGVWFDRKSAMTEIVIGEGIETTISAMQATGKNGVSALSTAGMKGLILPEETEIIYILVDSDTIDKKPPMPGQHAAYALAMRFVEEKDERKAFLVSPDDTCFSENPVYLDFNDLLQEDPTGESIRDRFSKAVEVRDLEWRPQEKVENSDNKKTAQDTAEQTMFDRFVFLASENKIIDTWGNDIKDSTMIERAFTISQAGSFKTITDQDGNEKAIPMTQYWLSADSKKIAYSLRYRPGQKLLFENGDGRTYYNTFRFPFSSREPMAVPEQEKRLGSWNKIMDTVFHEHRSYIEDFFSFSIQFPEKRAGIMPVCISDVGLGKSLVMAIVSRVIGSHNFSNAKILDVTGLGKSGTQWGDWIFNKKISCIEEIDPEGETGISYKILDALKDIITNETLSLNLKGGKNGTFRVYSNIIGFSNHHNCVKIPYGDRRLFIVDSTGQDLLSKQEYVELWDWIMDKQNSFAVFQYLLKRKISDEFIPGQAKMTKAKLALQVDGRSTLQQAFDLVVNDYPSDLITSGELQLAVADAMNLIDDSGTDHRAINWNSEKQFQAIMKTTTTLINGGKRLKVRRHGSSDSKACTVRALRNGQDWSGATPNEIRDAMFIEIPWKWIPESRELEVPF